MGKPSGVELDEALDRVSLYRYGDTRVSNLSAGQKRRLALSRLIVTETLVWILDEPFTSLDKKSMAGFELMFEQHLAEQGVIVMTSHHDIGMLNADIQRLDLSQ